MPAIAHDSMMTNLTNTEMVAYFSPYHQRPPEPSLFLNRTSKFNANSIEITTPNPNNVIMAGISISLDINNAFDAIQKNQCIEIETLKTKIKQYACDPNSDSDVDAISETIEFTFELISKFGPVVLDLSQFKNPENLNGEHLAAILRVTHSYKKQIPGWEHALKLATQALRVAKLDPADALAGII